MSGRSKRGRTREVSPPGPAQGWIRAETFRQGGRKASADSGVTVAVVNPKCDTAWTDSARLELLKSAYAHAPTNTSLVLLTSGGFFGYAAKSDGNGGWTDGGDRVARERALVGLVQKWPACVALAVGVDFGGAQQEQWWLRGGSRTVKRIVRDESELDERLVEHDGLAFLGFVCGESYEWDEPTLLAEVGRSADVVAISSHVRMNRQWSRTVDNPKTKWFAFQRLLQSVSRRGGACLAHARADLERDYVRDCDNWFVHRGGVPFPGARHGRPVQGRAS